MKKFYFILILALIGCNAAPPTTSEQLIPVVELAGLGLDINDSIVIEKPGIDIQFKRISEDFYQVRQTVPAPTPYFRKQKNIYHIENNINSGNKDKSKFEVVDKSKDKSQANSGNKDKSKIKTDNSTDNSSKSLINIPWWLWLILIILVLLTVFYKKIKARIPLPWRSLLPCTIILLACSGCAIGYNPERYPIGEKFYFYYADSTLGEGYVFVHHPFVIEMVDDTANIEDANLGIIRPKFLIRPINVNK